MVGRFQLNVRKRYSNNDPSIVVKKEMRFLASGNACKPNRRLDYSYHAVSLLKKEKTSLGLLLCFCHRENVEPQLIGWKDI